MFGFMMGKPSIVATSQVDPAKLTQCAKSATEDLVTRGGPLAIANDPKPVEAEVVEAAA